MKKIQFTLIVLISDIFSDNIEPFNKLIQENFLV
jgi:hypothetical protein